MRLWRKKTPKRREIDLGERIIELGGLEFELQLRDTDNEIVTLLNIVDTADPAQTTNIAMLYCPKPLCSPLPFSVTRISEWELKAAIASNYPKKGDRQ